MVCNCFCIICSTSTSFWNGQISVYHSARNVAETLRLNSSERNQRINIVLVEFKAETANGSCVGKYRQTLLKRNTFCSKNKGIKKIHSDWNRSLLQNKFRATTTTEKKKKTKAIVKCVQCVCVCIFSIWYLNSKRVFLLFGELHFISNWTTSPMRRMYLSLKQTF